MTSIDRLLDALDGILGKESTAPLRWKYGKALAEGKILLPPPHPITAYGLLDLGEVIWQEKAVATFGLYPSELTQHIALYGRTGAGKTNCAFLLIQALLRENIPVLVFDWKNTYRPLCGYGFNLFTPGHQSRSFSFNPLDLSPIPPASQEAYLRQLLSVVLTVYFRDLKLLSVEGVEYLLLKSIHLLRSSQPVITFADLYKWILNYQGISREKDWKSSLLNMLYKLSTGPIGSVLNNPHSLSLKDIIQKNTIIELQWLGSPKDKSFLIQSLFLQLYYLVSQEPSKTLKHFILIEEAHNVLLKHLEGYETVVEMILRQIREYGVGIGLLDQHPSLMSLPALGTFCTIAFSLRARDDLVVMDSALGLEDQSELLTKLSVGKGIVKVQDRFHKPFLVSFPLAKLPQSVVTDLQVSPRISPEISRIERVSESDNLIRNPKNKLLKDIFLRPLVKTVERYKDLELNPRKGNLIKDELLKSNLIMPVEIFMGRTRIKLFEVTQAGKMKLRELGIKTPSSKRHGSLVHAFWCDEIKKRFEQEGYQVKQEYAVGGGKAVDLVAKKAGKRTAIEVETGRSDIYGNVRKCKEAGFERIVVAAVSRDLKRRLEGKLGEGVILVEVYMLKVNSLFS